MKAELELAEADGEPALAKRLRGDLSDALDLLGLVEAYLFRMVPVLVVDDDERLGELTARGLRRLGFEAESSASVRKLRPGEIIVLDLSLSGSLGPDERAILVAARPIVVTGAADPASRARADELGASEYLVKPVDLGALATAIQRRVELKL
ncbi:MAG TPA: response regulator [Solirubrobacteraceae bacterium]